MTSLTLSLSICTVGPWPEVIKLFSLPGRSPGRDIVLPPASASASALAKC